MKINGWVIAIIVISIIAFVIFIVKRNRIDQKSLENELNEKEVKPSSNDEPRI